MFILLVGLKEVSIIHLLLQCILNKISLEMMQIVELSG